MNLPTYLIEFKTKEYHCMVANPPKQYADYCNETLVKGKDIKLVDEITMYTPQSSHPTERILHGKAMLVIRKGEHIKEMYWNYGEMDISYVVNKEAK